jgi:hypothetical protein
MLEMPQMIQTWKEVGISAIPKPPYRLLTTNLERTWSWMEEVAEIDVKFSTMLPIVIFKRMMPLYEYCIGSIKHGKWHWSWCLYSNVNRFTHSNL